MATTNETAGHGASFSYSRAVVFLLLLGLLLASVGCNCEIVRNIYYPTPITQMRLTNAPETPVAVVYDFVDERSGSVRGSPYLDLWLVPYVTFEFPQFLKEPAERGAYAPYEPSDESPLLSDQFKTVLERHLDAKSIFRFPKLDAELSPEMSPLFEVSGVIHKVTARANYSLFGLGLVPGLVPLGGLISYVDCRYMVDVALECRDIKGKVVAKRNITGRTKRAIVGSIPALTEPAYLRLRPLQEFLQPQIETFAKQIHDALADKDESYWRGLIDERNAQYTRRMASSRVAVIELRPIGVRRSLGESLARVVRNTLASSQRGVMSQDDMVSKLGAELPANCDTPALWQELGRKLGASELVVGTVEKRDAEYIIVLKLIDVGSLRPVNIITASCESASELEHTASAATQRLLSR
ncbi:MAG TPA: hypothetical protein VM163_07400 [bacterium]|nr:hypothetical protein [bacterium]